MKQVCTKVLSVLFVFIDLRGYLGGHTFNCSSINV